MKFVEKEIVPFHPFLTFNGNCRQAMQFYQSCFGGDLSIMLLSASPHGLDFPKGMQDYVLQAVLTSEPIKIFASDLGLEENLIKGNQISLLIKTKGLTQLQDYFSTLSRGTVFEKRVPGDDFKPGELLNLTDKFGINWIVYF